MRKILLFLSWCGLILTIVPPVLYFFDTVGAVSMKGLLPAGACLWFGSRIPLRGGGQGERTPPAG